MIIGHFLEVIDIVKVDILQFIDPRVDVPGVGDVDNAARHAETFDLLYLDNQPPRILNLALHGTFSGKAGANDKITVTATLDDTLTGNAAIAAANFTIGAKNWPSAVTMQAVANVVRAIGALPVMALARPDAEQMVEHADALVLSLGTPTPDRLDAMLAAGHDAAALGRPIVLDPVGVGATEFRGEAARRFMEELPIAVIRANRGETEALLGRSGHEKDKSKTCFRQQDSVS
jgi:hypothetical protein